MIESLFLTTTRITTFLGEGALTNASGFFFERDRQLFLVTSRHVVNDDPSNHHPDRIEIELHSNENNLVESISVSISLYANDKPVWRQGVDSGGGIDVAAIPIERSLVPLQVLYRAFSTDNLVTSQYDAIEMGASLLIVGFPLGFHDTLHHLPVARQAMIASCFGLRFQGEGYFLTDARTHRGSSGAPVVMRMTPKKARRKEVPWFLLGVHSSRMYIQTRTQELDEALGLNCAWYADILIALTAVTSNSTRTCAFL